MKDLSKIVQVATDQMIQSGKIEEIITKKLEETISSGIDDALRSYSDFGKTITEKIKESIQCAGRDIEIPAYNHFIVKVIKEKFTQVLEENAANHLAELVSNVIKPIKKEAKISEFLNFVSEAWTDTAREQGKEYIEIDVDENDEGTALYVTIKHPEYDWETVKVTFYNFKSDKDNLWHIGYINEGDQRITGRPNDRAASGTTDVTDMLFKYYAMGTKFDMDTEIENIYVADY